MTEEKNPKVLIETTIGQMGRALVIGSNASGAPDKRLMLRELTTADERVIANKTKDNMSMAEQISIVIAQAVDQLGEWDLSQLKFPERLIRINNFYMADILATLIHLRLESIGSDLSLSFKCTCNPQKSWNISADLKTTKVLLPPTEKETVWEYRLKSPITVREKKVESFMIGSPRWGVMTKMATTSRKEAELETVRSCIIGVNGNTDVPGYELLQQEFDTVKKKDLSGILSEINDHTVGPQMWVDTQCPNCDLQHRLIIDWQYSRFFSVPSQSSL